jgi:SAM-dependent methyltransferase
MPLLRHQGVKDFEHGIPAAVDFRQCATCGTLAQDPRPSREQLATFYPSDYRPHASKGVVAALKGLQATLLARKFRPALPGKNDRILELGCATGAFLKALGKMGYQRLEGVDRSPALGESFRGTAIRYHASDLESGFGVDGRFSAIFMNYVIEHFADPEAILRRCRERLEPGGRVAMLTPNAESLCSSFWGRYWSGLHAPRHTMIFTPRALELLAKKTGFAGADISFINDPAGWALSFQNLIQSRRRAAPRGGTAWYSLAAMPFFYPFALAERAAGRGSAMLAVFRP